jgi:hypothetical protein
MKIFINGILLSAEDTPIVICLTEEEKQSIAAMPKDFKYFMAYPKSIDIQEAETIALKAKALNENE